MKKFFLINDNTKKALNFKKKLLKKIKNHNPKKADIFLVAGGDGFMLNTLKKYYKYKKPFYGINCGSFGFLMNKDDQKSFHKKVKISNRTNIYPLKIFTTDLKNKKKSLMAINEVSLLRQSKQTTSLNLKIGGKIIIKNLIGDGILVSTPAGSTAYNLSVHGPILNLNSGKLAVTPISPFRPRRWKGKIVSNKSIVKILNLNPKKRPVAASADNVEIRNIKSVVIKNDIKNKITLLYDNKRSLNKRIMIEQLIKTKTK
jgi:NAD+ kinase